MRYGDALGKGICFAVDPRRWLPVFIVDLAFFTLAVGSLASPDLLWPLLRTLLTPAAAPVAGFASLGLLALLAVAWFLARLWVTGAVIHQAAKGKEFRQSWRVSWERYPHQLLAMVAVIALVFVVASVPLFGTALSAILSISLYFVLQAVVIRKVPASRALGESYRLFKRHLSRVRTDSGLFVAWIILAAFFGILSLYFFALTTLVLGASAVAAFTSLGAWVTLTIMAFFLLHSAVFRAWLAVSLGSGAIALLYIVPLLGIVAASMPPALAAEAGSMLGGVLFALAADARALYLLGSIFLVGGSISTAFALKTQTEFYLQLTKKRLGLF
ncbi:MAG: hypothetical protein HY369_00700 [Candidatus Aenigmarchaeota archaeon]|nr:hypothetical protein [Candidatus Aenigmarchaeota archaeon]